MSDYKYWHEQAMRLAEEKARLLAALKLSNQLLTKVCNEKTLWLVEDIEKMIEEYTPSS